MKSRPRSALKAAARQPVRTMAATEKVPLLPPSAPSAPPEDPLPTYADAAALAREAPSQAPERPSEQIYLVSAYGDPILSPEGRWAGVRRALRAFGGVVARLGHRALGTTTHIRRLAAARSLRGLVERYKLRRVVKALFATETGDLDFDIINCLIAAGLRSSWARIDGPPFTLRADDWRYLLDIGLQADDLPWLFRAGRPQRPFTADLIARGVDDAQLLAHFGRAPPMPTLDDLLVAGLRPGFLSVIGVNARLLIERGVFTPADIARVTQRSRPRTSIPPAYAPLTLADWQMLGVNANILNELGIDPTQTIEIFDIHASHFYALP